MEVKRVHIALMLSAAAGLIYEVVATHVLLYYFVQSTYSISTVLSVFLLGLGIGSFFVYKFKNKIKRKYLAFGVLQIIIALYAFFVLSNLTQIMPRINTLGLFFTSVAILLIPTIGLGAIFPLAGSIISKWDKESIGLVYSIDLMGAVIGSLMAGFWLIPILGNKLTILFAVVLNLISAALMFRFKKSKKIFFFILIITAVLLFFIFSNMTFNSKGDNFSLEYYEELEFTGNYLTNYLRAPSAYGEIVIRGGMLYIDAREQCLVSYPDYAGEVEIVDYSLNPFNSRNVDVLNIGLGCGVTLTKILDSVDVGVDIVEINQVVVEANKLISPVLKNERVNLIVDEGVNYLRESDKKYDSIIIDIENPAVIHSSDIYTVESFNEISNDLNDEGIFGLWICPCSSKEFLDTLYYTLNEVFPYVYQVRIDVFIASKQKLDYEEYIPINDKKINTLDKKILSKIYFDQCKWWENQENILDF